MSAKVEVRHVNHPDYQGHVDAAKYTAMKAAALPQLPVDLFPKSKTAGWWSKTVQLDLEARGDMGRTNTKPLRFFYA